MELFSDFFIRQVIIYSCIKCVIRRVILLTGLTT